MSVEQKGSKNFGVQVCLNWTCCFKSTYMVFCQGYINIKKKGLSRPVFKRKSKCVTLLSLRQLQELKVSNPPSSAPPPSHL